MRQITVVSFVTGLLAISTPAFAGMDPESYEVLGVHFGDSQTAVSSAMARAGFQPELRRELRLNECRSSYAAVKAKYVASRTTRIQPLDLDCQVNFQKGNGDRVTVSYLYSPRGPVVSALGYTFKSTEEVDGLAARLTSKFGQACKSSPGYNYSWRSSSRCSDFECGISLANSTLTGSFMISMSNSDMRAVFAEELGKDIAAALGNEPAAL